MRNPFRYFNSSPELISAPFVTPAQERHLGATALHPKADIVSFAIEVR